MLSLGKGKERLCGNNFTVARADFGQDLTNDMHQVPRMHQAASRRAMVRRLGECALNFKFEVRCATDKHIDKH